MDLATMRTKFVEKVANMVPSSDTTTIDALLNRAHKFILPVDIPGTIGEYIWELECVVGQSVYQYPSHVIAPRDKAWIKSYQNDIDQEIQIGLFFLGVNARPGIFEYQNYINPTDSSRPTSILFYGTSLTLDKSPDLKYNIEIPIRGGPVDNLTSDGITDELVADAVVKLAAMDYLEDMNQDELLKSVGDSYVRTHSRLRTKFLMRPRERQWRRSF